MCFAVVSPQCTYCRQHACCFGGTSRSCFRKFDGGHQKIISLTRGVYCRSWLPVHAYFMLIFRRYRQRDGDNCNSYGAIATVAFWYQHVCLIAYSSVQLLHPKRNCCLCVTLTPSLSKRACVCLFVNVCVCVCVCVCVSSASVCVWCSCRLA